MGGGEVCPQGPSQPRPTGDERGRVGLGGTRGRRSRGPDPGPGWGPPLGWDGDPGQRERLFRQRAAPRFWEAVSRGWVACVDGGLTGSAWVGQGCSGEGGSPGTERSVVSGRFVGRGCGMGLWTHRAGEEGGARGPLQDKDTARAHHSLRRGPRTAGVRFVLHLRGV